MRAELLGLPIEKLINSRPAVVDGDSFAYIIGYNHQHTQDPDLVIANVDDFLHTIMQSVQSRYILGILNPKSSDTGTVRNFRADIAITKEYKGNRGEKPEWYQIWAPIIEQRLIDHWGFRRVPSHLEADDVVATVMHILNQVEGCTPICCGCDKDLLQIPGNHYNYRTNLPLLITREIAIKNLFTQVLMGDSTDNIPGLEKCGKVGAEKILTAEGIDDSNAHIAVLYAFTNKMGVDRGIQSFYENYMLCALRIDESFLAEYIILPYDLDGNAVREVRDTTEEIEESNFSVDFNIEGDLFSAN